MNLLEALKDPNIQKFLMPLAIGFLAIVSNYAINQLPPLKNGTQRWRMLKLAVEACILGVFLTATPVALEVVKSSEKALQIAGLVFFIVMIGLLWGMGFDAYQLLSKKGRLEERNRQEESSAKYRQMLIDKVRVKIDHKLKNSLYQVARMDLGLEERPEILGLQMVGREREVLPKGTRLFDRLSKLGSGGTLLVLGEPGAGKTTMLMELASDWLGCTDAKQFDQAIPVVLNLSSWVPYRLTKQPLTFADWVVEELHRHYHLPTHVGKDWLAKSSFVLLLDGLDEVAEPLRDGCVDALKQFRQKFGMIEMAVCSRIAELQKLMATWDHFQAVVFIQPLEEVQVEDYLQQAGELLQGVRKALHQDPTLLEMARTPFFLWILSLAYPQRSADELLNLPKPERLRRLFDRYIEQMFQNRPMANSDQMKMIRVLSILGKRMGIKQKFLIGQMQPRDWLVTSKYKWLYRLTFGLSIGLPFGLIFGLSFGLSFGLFAGLFVGLFVGLILALTIEVYFGVSDQTKADLQIGIFREKELINSIEIMGFCLNSCFVLIFALVVFHYYLIPVLPSTTYINSVKNSIFGAFLSFFLMYFLFWTNSRVCIQNFSLRLVLYLSCQIPWNFEILLKEAEVRLFIQNTDSTYSFIHRYLQEYFASIAPQD